jgi:hypothetical protein
MAAAKWIGKPAKAMRVKRSMKKKRSRDRPDRNMTDEQKATMRDLYFKGKEKPSRIAKIFKRTKSCMTRILSAKPGVSGPGRPLVLSKKQVDNLEKRLEETIAKADALKEVTYDMLERRTKCKASVKTIRRNLQKRKIKFRPLRSKPLLTDDDIKDRKAYAKRWAKKPKNFWQKKIRTATKPPIRPEHSWSFRWRLQKSAGARCNLAGI